MGSMKSSLDDAKRLTNVKSDDRPIGLAERARDSVKLGLSPPPEACEHMAPERFA